MAFRNKFHKYFETHHEECLARSRAWKAKNKDRARKYMREYMRRRNGVDPANYRTIRRRVQLPGELKLKRILKKVRISEPKFGQGRESSPVLALKLIDLLIRDSD